MTFMFVLISLVEVFGNVQIQRYLPFLLAVIPSLLFLKTMLQTGSFHIKNTQSGFLLTFTGVLYAASLLFSINKEASVNSVLWFCAFTLFFLYSSTYQENRKNIIRTIFAVSLLYCAGFIIWRLYPHILSIQHADQLMIPFYQPHNHLGDLLGISILIALYYFTANPRLIYLIPVGFFFPFLLISFSNSAYLSFTITSLLIFLNGIKKGALGTKKTILILFFFCIGILVFVFGSVRLLPKTPIQQKINKIFSNTFSFSPKTTGSNRIVYFAQALEGIQRHPLFGVGPNNFAELSRELKKSRDDFTTDAHNVFFEISVESGILTLLFFALFVFTVMRRGINNASLLFFLFLYLLLNFQTDYTYKIASAFFLFIVFAAQSENRSEAKPSRLLTAGYIIGSFVLQITVIFLLASLIFQKVENPYLAIRCNPFNRTAYYDLINQAVKTVNKEKVDVYAIKLRAISSVNTQSELVLADAYKAVGEPKKQYITLQTAYRLQPLLSTSYMETLFNLTVKYESRKQAEQLITTYIANRKKASFFSADKQTFTELKNLCAKTFNKGCKSLDN